MTFGLGLAVLAAATAAQTPSRADHREPWRWQPVAGADATVLALRWGRGFVDDAAGEHGAAAAVAEYRLLRARAAVPTVTASGVRVVGDATVTFVLVPAVRAADAVAFCRALLDDAAPLDDDLAALARARAALAADDADWLYPGPVLIGRARRALCTGAAANGVAGTAVELQRLGAARLAELLAAPVRVVGLGLGALPSDLRQRAAALPLPGAPSEPPPDRAAAGSAPVGVDVQPHARADGPIVALAFPTDRGLQPMALCAGVEVARMRAARDLPLRGPEAHARMPLVHWSWLDGDPVLVLLRRGVDGAAPDGAFAELDALVADLRTRPPTVAELDTARRTLRWEFGLLPLPPGTDGAALPGRAIQGLLAELRGADDAALAAVTPAAAHAALGAVLDPVRVYRGALVPAEPPASR